MHHSTSDQNANHASHSPELSGTSSSSQLHVRAVDELEQLSGVHPGYRRAHARGQCHEAVFYPNGAAAEWTNAAHLQTQPTPAIVRFSGNSTDPALADLLSPAKGMAVQFQLPDGASACLVGVTVPVFFARTPETFMDMLTFMRKVRAGKAGWLEMIREMHDHFAEARESLLHLQKLRPPQSYATVPYYCIHAYVLTGKDASPQPVRFEWKPEAGAHHLSPTELSGQPDDYLEQEIAQRLQEQEAVFTLEMIIGEADDRTDDPTTAWPDDRRRIDIGRLVITKPIEEPEGLVMDPTLVTTGIELSDDPILQFRRHAYSESWRRRSTEEGQREDQSDKR